MKVLIIGAGGREHALAQAYAKSKRVKKVIMTPGNGLTDFQNPKIKNYSEVAMSDFEGVLDICKKEKIDLVDVAQDDIIAAGYVDRLGKLGIRTFGPTQKASQLEWDKQWARNFMVKYGLPIPHFKSFTNKQVGIEYVKGLYQQRHPGERSDSRIPIGFWISQNDGSRVVFVKAAGLALGKGVIKATNREEAIDAIKQMSTFGIAGETFLIEQGLIGEEFSLFALCDGENYKVTGWAQDHKTIYDGDRGPNTGGVGSVAPAVAIDSSLVRTIELKILRPLMEGMKKEGRPYKGILYLGGMIINENQYSSSERSESRSSRQARTINSQVKIIEFNCRWGDPEAEVILPGIQTDYVDVVEAVLEGQLNKFKIELDKKVRLSVAGCSRGYPGDYSKVKGKEIFGLTAAMKLPGISIFGAGIKRQGDRFFVNGGRVFHLVAEGDTVIQARVRAYGAMAMISIEGDNLHYRTDIGWRDIARFTK